MVDEEEKEDTGLTTGQKVAIGAAAVIGIGLLAYGIYYFAKQAAAPPGPPGPSAGKGNVEITVLNGTTSPPAPMFRASLNLVNPSTGEQLVDITDASGKHTYRDVSPGIWTLYVAAGAFPQHSQTVIVMANSIIPITVKFGVAQPSTDKFDCDVYINIYNQNKILVPYNDADLNAGEGEAAETVTGLHLQLQLLKQGAGGLWTKIVDTAVPAGGYISLKSLEVNQIYELILYTADATNTRVVRGQMGSTRFGPDFCFFDFIPAIANGGTFARMTINVGKCKNGTIVTGAGWTLPVRYDFMLDIDTTIYLQRASIFALRPREIIACGIYDGHTGAPAGWYDTYGVRVDEDENIVISGTVFTSAGDARLTPKLIEDTHTRITYSDTIPVATTDIPVAPPAQFIMPSVIPPHQSAMGGPIGLPIRKIDIDTVGKFDGVVHPLTLSHFTFNYMSGWIFTPP